MLLLQMVSDAAEVKIVYAVNPHMPSQLYEVDVFMFFLKDLEAVSNNFYHDLWQVARLHTPKVACFNATGVLISYICRHVSYINISLSVHVAHHLNLVAGNPQNLPDPLPQEALTLSLAKVMLECAPQAWEVGTILILFCRFPWQC